MWAVTIIFQAKPLNASLPLDIKRFSNYTIQFLQPQSSFTVTEVRSLETCIEISRMPWLNAIIFFNRVFFFWQRKAKYTYQYKMLNSWSVLIQPIFFFLSEPPVSYEIIYLYRDVSLITQSVGGQIAKY